MPNLDRNDDLQWRRKALSCVPFLLGLVFYGWRYTLQPVLEPIKENGAIVGIELGSVYSRVSLLVADQVHVLEDDFGRRKIPSRICFTETEVIVGYECDSGDVYDTRELLEATVSSLSPNSNQGAPIVTARINGTVQNFNATEIVSMVLRSLVSRAEILHGKRITCAILTIPAHFTDAHRSILHDAAHLADLAILRTVTEPIATAIAHGLDSSRTAKDEQRVLVLDVGSSVSAALLEINSGVFETLAHARNRWTGGRALDERIAQYAEAVHIRMTGKGREGTLRAAQMDLLRVRAEEAKIALSKHQKVTIDVPTNDDAVFPVQLTRREFGEITTDLFEDVMLCAEEVLLEANVAATDVDHIILAGGVAYIPRLSELLSTRFSGATALYSREVRPDETVVYGAALYARHYFNITPLAFGIEAPDGVFTVILPRNSVLPNTKTRSFNLTKEVRVLVGYGEHISGTHFLGSLVLPPPVGGEVQVRFDMDEAGVLTVGATDASGRSTSTTIRPSEETDAATARILAELEGANRDIAKAQIQYASHAKLTAFLGDLERFIATLPADHEGRPSADMLVGIIREADAWIAQNLYTKDAEALRDKMMAVERLVRLLTPQSPFWSSGADESQWEERRTEL